MQVVPQSSFVPRPWKNGGGVTLEALRMPAEGEPFRWRVSVAEVAASGPFSDFSGYRRYMVLLRGDGIRLRFASGDERRLERIGDLAEFDGGVATFGELLGGACTDLNLIISQSIAGIAARTLELRGSRNLSQNAHPRQTTLVFCIAGSVLVSGAAAESATLAAGDLALGSAEAGGIDSVSSPGGAAPARLLLAHWAEN